MCPPTNKPTDARQWLTTFEQEVEFCLVGLGSCQTLTPPGQVALWNYISIVDISQCNMLVYCVNSGSRTGTVTEQILPGFLFCVAGPYDLYLGGCFRMG